MDELQRALRLRGLVVLSFPASGATSSCMHQEETPGTKRDPESPGVRPTWQRVRAHLDAFREVEGNGSPRLRLPAGTLPAPSDHTTELRTDPKYIT